LANFVTIQRTLALACPCGRLHECAFPQGVTETMQYGPKVRTPGVRLTQGQMLPHAHSRIDALLAKPVAVKSYSFLFRHVFHPRITNHVKFYGFMQHHRLADL